MKNQPQSLFSTSVPWTQSHPDTKVDVLLVDDRPENLIALEAVLEGLGQNLIKVQSGEAALKYLLQKDVAVILLDVQMPGMDGFETARLIRQRERSQHTPIIFLTAFQEGDELRSLGYTLGAVDYLYKPINSAILASKVSVFIELFKKNLEVQQQATQLIAKNAEIIRAHAARQQAEEANRLKDEFLAIVSHEVRTPLNSILGWSQLLLKREFDTATTQRALETIARNAKAQAKIIEDILDISKLMRGKVELSLQPVDLNSFIHTTIESISPQVEAKALQLSVQLDSTLPRIEADPGRLRQIIWNLLTNAIKFTPEGGQIEVKLEQVRLGNEEWKMKHEDKNSMSDAQFSWVQLSVRDTGIGIEPEFLPHIFDHFRQADSSAARTHGGLGLGLAIVRQLVELHHGEISVYSDGCNQGSTFIVQLPVSTQAGEAINPPSENPDITIERDSTPLKQMQVLLIEDHDDSREFVQRILEDAGATVITANCAEDALTLLNNTQPHVIVSDIAMPGEDGYQLIRQIRAFSAQEIPAIALTAYVRPEDRREALNAGFHTHLAKPVNADELVGVIAQLVKQFATLNQSLLNN
ncbi:MAG: response regulator [Leptolyngbyaceae cyanobacterium bins.302]|nr:response regulator [Leptolyngbyaceae cyanobacterium bins.302]